MKKELFDFIKTELLCGMPYGNLVTRDAVEFEVHPWQYKSYDDNKNIRAVLRGKWCSNTINILHLEDSITIDEIAVFADSNLFDTLLRDFYFVQTLSIPSRLLSSELVTILKKSEFPMSQFKMNLLYDDRVIFINEFIKNKIIS